MLHKTSLALNAVIVALSLWLFSYTFFAKNHLVEHTRAFVTEKTVSYSKPLVEFMESGLKAPLSQKLLPEVLRSEIEKEIAVYNYNPAEYVTSLTSEKENDFGEGKVAKFKGKVHKHYQLILEDLIRDLRIFSGSNLVAGVCAMWLLLLNKFRFNGKVVAFSFVIFAAVAFSSYSYIEGVSFLRILLKSHLGWLYPAGIAVMIVGLVLDLGLLKEKDAEQRRGGQASSQS